MGRDFQLGLVSKFAKILQLFYFKASANFTSGWKVCPKSYKLGIWKEKLKPLLDLFYNISKSKKKGKCENFHAFISIVIVYFSVTPKFE